MRSGLLLDELYSRGHKVTWWGASFVHLLKKELVRDDENVNYRKNYTIKLLHANKYKRNISLAFKTKVTTDSFCYRAKLVN